MKQSELYRRSASSLRKTILFSLVAGAGIVADAAVTLPSYLTDNMVVQRNSRLTVRGSARPESTVTATGEWSGKAVTARAGKDGRFTLVLPTPEAGGPYAIDFTDGDGATTSLENILSGEVWLASGQSNMEFPVKPATWAVLNSSDDVIATAQHPDIRLLKITRKTAYEPQEDVTTAGWKVCTPSSVQDFSAVAYLYARNLQKELGVPVGIIDTSWGGTPAEAWTPAEELGSVPGFKEIVRTIRENGHDPELLLQKQNERMVNWLTKMHNFDKSVYQAGKQGWNAYMPKDAVGGVPADVDGVIAVQYVLDIPADKAGQPLALSLGIFDDDDVTFFNGKYVGATVGAGSHRNYTVDASLVKHGKNVITSFIADYGGPGGFVPSERKATVGDLVIPIDGSWLVLNSVNKSAMGDKPLPLRGPLAASALYNGMLEPLKSMPIKGAIWYQGCNNVGRADQYSVLFPTMIRGWRRLWGYDFPFYFVQLAGYKAQQNLQPDSEWAALRQAQTAALHLPHTGMATAVDAGHPYDIHPGDKYRVADRLSRLALANDYGKDVVCKAPEAKSVVRNGSKVTVTFTADVEPRSVAVSGFILGGADGTWALATGRMTSPRTVELSSRKIAEPVAVKYNWADYPIGNLYGDGDLPVTPFFQQVK